MSRRLLLVLPLIAAFGTSGVAKSPSAEAAPRQVAWPQAKSTDTPIALGSRPSTETIRGGPVMPLPPIVAPTPTTLESLLDQLEILRNEKAVIEQREAAVLKAIAEHSARQSERMRKLGIDPLAPKGPAPAKSPMK